MNHISNHITPYRLYASVLVGLLILTAITITVTWIDVGAFTVALAMGIALVKATLVLLFFMHLKFDHLIFKIFAAMVFILLAIVFVITFMDYLYR